MSLDRFRIPAMVLVFAAPAVGDAFLAAAIPVVPASESHLEIPVMKTHPYVGMWVTADGRIRHELLPDGRYDEARGHKQSAYQGSYTITGNHIDYVDDTGFTADGEFVEGVLYHAGMVLYRKD